jgi:hypothetical protein
MSILTIWKAFLEEMLSGKRETMTPTLVLQRGFNPGLPFQASEGTPGSLADICKILELPKGKRIPAGTYLCLPELSPRFKATTYHLQNVPGFTYIEIHWGDWAGDVSQDWYSDSEGCLITGMGFSRLAPSDSGISEKAKFTIPQLAIVSSKVAFNTLMTRMGGKPFNIQILDEPTQ